MNDTAPLTDERLHWTLLHAANLVPAGTRAPLATVFENPTLTLRIYAPRAEDEQAPHDQDELYVIAKGSGVFVNGARSHSFGQGDVIFVPAGVPHRFKHFTPDLLVWVVFCGAD